MASAPVTLPASPVLPPAKVTGVKAKVHKGQAKITWRVVSGATSYRVRISKPGGKKFKAWKTTSKGVFTARVHKGKKYKVQIVAVGAGGHGPSATARFRG